VISSSHLFSLQDNLRIPNQLDANMLENSRKIRSFQDDFLDPVFSSTLPYIPIIGKKYGFSPIIRFEKDADLVRELRDDISDFFLMNITDIERHELTVRRISVSLALAQCRREK